MKQIAMDGGVFYVSSKVRNNATPSAADYCLKPGTQN